MAEDSNTDARLLASLAQRAAKRPGFFAGVLARYSELRKLDDAGLCLLLSCDDFTLNRLRLCKRPDAEPFAFSIDIRRVAEALDLDASLLAGIVREVDAWEASEAVTGVTGNPFSSTPALLSAARDREDSSSGDQQEGADEVAPSLAPEDREQED